MLSFDRSSDDVRSDTRLDRVIIDSRFVAAKRRLIFGEKKCESCVQ